MPIIKTDEATAYLRYIYFMMVSNDPNTAGQPVTGLTAPTLSAHLVVNGVVTAGAGTFGEVSAANMPGLYYYDPAPGEYGPGVQRIVPLFKAPGCTGWPADVPVHPDSFYERTATVSNIWDPTVTKRISGFEATASEEMEVTVDQALVARGLTDILIDALKKAGVWNAGVGRAFRAAADQAFQLEFAGGESLGTVEVTKDSNGELLSVVSNAPS